MRRIRSLLAALALAATPLTAHAQTAEQSDGAKQIIQRQLDAFAHDDAPGAYAFAAPRVKAIFPDPNLFLMMVANGYAPVYRHRNVEFGPTKLTEFGISQAVTFTDGDGQVWAALYTLEKQDDGGWAISGCVVVKSAEKAL